MPTKGFKKLKRPKKPLGFRDTMIPSSIEVEFFVRMTHLTMHPLNDIVHHVIAQANA
jgi:hypothetical protein